MTRAMDVLGKKYPDQDVGSAYALKPLIDATVGELRPILLILLSATGLLLLRDRERHAWGVATPTLGAG